VVSFCPPGLESGHCHVRVEQEGETLVWRESAELCLPRQFGRDIRIRPLDILREQQRPKSHSLLANHGAALFHFFTGAKHRTGIELARPQRDLLVGIHHPSDTEYVHNTVTTNSLGALA